MLTVSATDLGTPEAVWRADPGLAAIAPLDLATVQARCERAVVVAPHPDDEVFGAGGIMRVVARLGLHVQIVAVTNGEASHPGSRWTGHRMASRRRYEAELARRRLDLASIEVRRAAIPDGHVREQEAVLTDLLVDLLDPETLCVSTWRHDGHPDHDASGRAAAVASEQTSAPLLEYPIWAWHWATSSDELPIARARRLTLGAADRAAKTHAIDAFTSQLHPLGNEAAERAVLPPAVRRRFERPDEIFFVDDGAP